jgi:hypothetical protein
MPKSLSPIATSLITLLNNINDLVAISNNRQEARDVMEAVRIYARNANFVFPEVTKQKMDHFNAVLLDSRPITITYLMQDIAQDIAKMEFGRKV